MRNLTRLLSAVVLALGAMVLLGWVIGSSALTRVNPWSGVAMKPNTALCFLLVGSALWISAVSRPSPPTRRAALAAAMATTLIGALTLFEIVTSVSLPVDQLIPGLDLHGDAPRMAPATALSMLLIGAGVVAVVTGRARLSRGRLRGYSKITRDLSERRAADEARTAASEELAASEEQLRLLVDGLRDHAILLLDQDGIIRTWNPDVLTRDVGCGATSLY
jgi:PAS domain-containing protein